MFSIVEAVESPQTRPRRLHKKSRQGCRTCKARKVKCDEIRPLCGNCSKHYEGIDSCDFDPFINAKVYSVARPSPISGRPLPYAPPSLQSTIITRPSGVALSNASRILELRLMHHYTTSTCGQLPDGSDSRAKHMWTIDIPQLAFQSDLVLNAMLGISALHLGSLAADDGPLLYAARHYFDKAVRKHRMLLCQVDGQSVEPLLASAILITHHTWLASHSTATGEPYVLPLQTYYMARGIQRLFDHMWPWLNGSGYFWFVEQQPIMDVSENACQNYSMESSLRDLAIISQTFDQKDVSANDKAVYKLAVVELESMYSSITAGARRNGIQRRVATMPLRLPLRFLELVELKDPRALALLARNLSLLKVIDAVWWLHGAGEYQVAERAIFGIRCLLPPNWLWTMDWPLGVVTGNLSLCG